MDKLDRQETKDQRVISEKQVNRVPNINLNRQFKSPQSHNE